MKHFFTKLSFAGRITLLPAIVFGFCAGKVYGQVSLTTPSAAYTQNFNAFAGTAPTGWAFTGTYRGQIGGSNCSSTQGGIYSFGSAGDFAFGLLRSGSNTTVALSVSFVNNTGSTITSINMSWDYRQYGGCNTSGLDLSGTGSFAGNGTINAADFTGTGGAAFGTTTPRTFTLTGLSIPNGATFGLSWNNTDASGSDNGLAIDNFSLTPFTSSPCTPPSLSNSITGVTCNGGTNGAINLTATGGSTPYTGYSWTRAGGGFTATTEDISSLGAGTYTVVVTATGGCTASTTAIVGQPSAISVTALTNAPLCLGDSLGLSATVSGGAGSYTYQWTGPNSFSSSALQNNFNPTTGSESGTYTVTVTDGSGCTKTGTTSVLVNTAPVINSTYTNISCFGFSDGSIDLGISGSVGPFGYSWTGPNGYSNTGGDQFNLAAGNYTVTVTAQQGSCSATQSFTIAEPADIIVFGTATSPLCAGDTLIAGGFALGGSGTLTYLWTGPNGFSSSQPVDTLFNVTSAGSGDYKLMVTDTNNCRDSIVTPVVIHSFPVLSAVVNNAACFGGSTGSVDLSVSAGTQPYTFGWTGPGSFAATTEDISTLAAGNYSVTVTGQGGCSSTAGVTVNAPSQLSVSVTSNSPVCEGDSLGFSASATGGSGTLTFGWTGPNSFTSALANTFVNPADSSASGSYMVLVTDTNNCTDTAFVSALVGTYPALATSITHVSCNGGTNASVDLTTTGGTAPLAFSWTGPNSYAASTEDIGTLAAGNYSVTVTGQGGCSATASVTVNEPSAIGIAVTGNTPVCEGDTLNINTTVNGGAGTFTYSWTGPNAYASSTQNVVINSIPAAGNGTYTLIVTDANNCADTISANIQVAQYPVLSAVVTGVSCHGDSDGAIDLTVTAGTGPFSYLWSGPNGFLAAMEDITNMLPGGYDIDVTGLGGCTTSATYTISEPAVVTVNAGVNGSVCEGDVLTLNGTATGGSGTLNYAWTGPDSFTASTSTAAVNPVTTASAGYYYLTVADANACTGTDSALATIDPLPQADGINVTQISNTNWTFAADNVSGADDYFWSFGDNNSSQGASSISHVYATSGTYIVSLILTNDCGSDTFTTQIIVDLVGISEVSDPNVVIYPNPATEMIYIQPAEKYTWEQISLMDITGKTVKTEAGSSLTQIGVQELVPGTYILILKGSEGETLMRKIIKQ